jgi:type VI secretion system secreted protein VgrG
MTLSGIAAAAASVQPTVGLGTAAPFAVLAGQTITNTGSSTISGDIGVYPGTAITGFPPGTETNGVQYSAGAVAMQAQSDLTTAYRDAAGRTPVTTEPPDLSGLTLAPGVYNSSSSALGLTGTVTLDGQGDASAVFIFQAGSTLITGSGSTVSLINGAQACNVFWQVTSSATLGTGTTFVGNILALTSASLQTGAALDGRVLARNGAVTLDDNIITVPTCNATPAATPTPTTTPAPTPTTTTTPAPPATTTTSSGPRTPGVPNTGAVGTSQFGDGLLVALGGVALLGAGVATGTIRRRRTPSGRDVLRGSEWGGDE